MSEDVMKPASINSLAVATQPTPASSISELNAVLLKIKKKCLNGIATFGHTHYNKMFFHLTNNFVFEGN